MKVQIKTFNELSGENVYNMLYLRNLVFVMEQNCVYLDTDRYDNKAHHVFISNSADELIAYCRIFNKDIKYTTCSIGRVVVHPKYRGKDVGHLLMKEATIAVEKLYHTTEITISAQAHLQKFYEQHGFVTVSDMYLEDDIPHVEMYRK